MTNIFKIDELVSFTKCEALLVIRKNHKYYVYQSPEFFALFMNDIVCLDCFLSRVELTVLE